MSIRAAILAVAVGACLLGKGPHAIAEEQAQPSAADFAGRYRTNWGTLVLRVDRGRLVGDYEGPFTGRVVGQMHGGRFRYFWNQTNGERGRGFFSLTATGISGPWGSGSSESDGGVWTGTRLPALRPGSNSSQRQDAPPRRTEGESAR